MKKQTFRSVLVIALGLFFTIQSHAAKFANQFVEFELPNAWVCVLEGSEWVCQDQQNKEKKKEAIIVLAAKIQGDQDTLDQYLAYLKKPKTYNNPAGKSVTSDVRYANNKTIQGKPWVDSLHLDSEIGGFYTRYLATVTDGLGILVTYSVHKNKYTEYAPIFENMVNSLKAFRREGGINAASGNSNLFKNTVIPTGITGDTVFGMQGAPDDEKKPQNKGGLAGFMNDPVMFYGSIAGVGLIAAAILKRRKK